MEDAVLNHEISDKELENLMQRVKAADQFDASPSGGSSNNDKRRILTDEFGFPFEPEGIYNSAPIEFEEIAIALWTVLAHTNYTACRYNRLSPYYIMLMQILEKSIKQMGSYCITKTVLEKSGNKYPDLEIINVKELYQMVSVHFRKCCMAYNDLQSGGKGLDMNMISWIIRWAALSERLKATQEKINNIQTGKIKIESLLAKETVYKGEPRRQRDHSPYLVGPKARTSSLPILKSFTNEVKTRRREGEKQERAIQREAQRAAGRLEKLCEKIPPEFRAPIIQSKPQQKIKDFDLNLKELKQLLMDEAKNRGDMAEAGIIAQEDENRLIERFLEFQNFHTPSNLSGPPENRSSGPSAEKRKKLREKRKKK
ncbi:MAG: hypothetical protein IJI14_18610 [Anaerolineaceae bacterium]|nr:hypothetical protein [Anaerolineaceae bacterium]